jgi:acyl carrier protein phosphodiesterase
MNFLAHLYLSGPNPKIKVGNFIGDFVKGRSFINHFETGIAQGIELHRAIDYFTDHHPVVQESKNRLRPKYRHYSGVIVDVFYDHFLASNWKDFSEESLANFAAQSYQIIEEHKTILPEEVKGMMPYMVSGNWLLNYSKIEGIHRALSGISRRTSFPSKMEEAAEDLKQNRSGFEQEFNLFFPELQKFCQDWIESLGLTNKE